MVLLADFFKVKRVTTQAINYSSIPITTKTRVITIIAYYLSLLLKIILINYDITVTGILMIDDDDDDTEVILLNWITLFSEFACLWFGMR